MSDKYEPLRLAIQNCIGSAWDPSAYQITTWDSLVHQWPLIMEVMSERDKLSKQLEVAKDALKFTTKDEYKSGNEMVLTSVAKVATKALKQIEDLDE